MAQARTLKVAIIGAGPRGTSVLERLLAHARDGALEGRNLDVSLIDPYPAGPGHVWRTDQSRLYLMNTQSFYPTLVPDGQLSPDAYASSSFEQWRVAQRERAAGACGPLSAGTPGAGSLGAGSPETGLLEDAGLSAGDWAELSALERDGFPSRALYGRYLRWTFEQLVQDLPPGISVTEIAAEALAVSPRSVGFTVSLATSESAATESAATESATSGSAATAGGKPRTVEVDAVVLALGHVQSDLSAAQQELADAADRFGLDYIPPAVPNDVDWAQIPAGATVLVRGLGLNFFDVLGQLTEGRGGRFVRDRNGTRYLPSGQEPRLVAASRRGVPYRAKAALQSYYPATVQLRYLTEAAVSRPAGAPLPSFDHDLWPLLHRDAVWAYYSTLARVRPSALPDTFLAALQDVLDSGPGWETDLGRIVAEHVPRGHRLGLEELARPLAGRHFGSQQELDAAVLEYLDEDARGSAAGEDDPVKMAIGALNAGRAVLKLAVADGGITDESWLGGLRGWFEGYVEGLASGPPALRIEQLAALVRAGLVSFTGPDPAFTLDPEEIAFTASSPWVRGERWAAQVLIEATAPANLVLRASSPLLRQLLADGLVRPKIMLAADGEPVATSGLDVTEPPYRAIGGDGHAVDGLYVLGLQLSSVQWGNAIAAQAISPYRSGYRTLLDADHIARHLTQLGRT